MDRIINGLISLASIGVLVGMVLKMQQLPYGHTVSFMSLVSFAILYPIQFWLMKQKNTGAYIRFFIVWAVVLGFLYFYVQGGIDQFLNR